MEVEIIQDMEIKAEQSEAHNIIKITEASYPNKNTIKLPEKYKEIYTSYTEKNYDRCLDILDKVTENHIEYQILKSACMIHMGKNLSIVHALLDG
jgi:hypothetical protein